MSRRLSVAARVPDRALPSPARAGLDVVASRGRRRHFLTHTLTVCFMTDPYTRRTREREQDSFARVWYVMQSPRGPPPLQPPRRVWSVAASPRQPLTNPHHAHHDLSFLACLSPLVLLPGPGTQLPCVWSWPSHKDWGFVFALEMRSRKTPNASYLSLNSFSAGPTRETARVSRWPSDCGRGCFLSARRRAGASSSSRRRRPRWCSDGHRAPLRVWLRVPSTPPATESFRTSIGAMSRGCPRGCRRGCTRPRRGRTPGATRSHFHFVTVFHCRFVPPLIHFIPCSCP